MINKCFSGVDFIQKKTKSTPYLYRRLITLDILGRSIFRNQRQRWKNKKLVSAECCLRIWDCFAIARNDTFGGFKNRSMNRALTNTQPEGCGYQNNGLWQIADGKKQKNCETLLPPGRRSYGSETDP